MPIKSILFIIVTICLLGINTIGNTNSVGHLLSFKKVIVDPNFNINPDYEYGKKLYPKYSLDGLPENFLIKKKPDISFKPADVELIEINTQPYFFNIDKLSVVVTIHFSTSIGNKLRDYTMQNLNSRVALDIDGEIFAIIRAVEVVEYGMKILLGERSVEEVEQKLNRISDNIVVKKQKDHPLKELLSHPKI